MRSPQMAKEARLAVTAVTGTAAVEAAAGVGSEA
jgi:hypothetical protein